MHFGEHNSAATFARSFLSDFKVEPRSDTLANMQRSLGSSPAWRARTWPRKTPRIKQRETGELHHTQGENPKINEDKPQMHSTRVTLHSDRALVRAAIPAGRSTVASGLQGARGWGPGAVSRCGLHPRSPVVGTGPSCIACHSLLGALQAPLPGS